MFTYKISKKIYNTLLDIQDEESINKILKEILMIIGIFTFCIVTIVTFALDVILSPLELIAFLILIKVIRRKI